MPQEVLSLLGMLVVVILVLGLAYLSTRLIARQGLPGLPRTNGQAAENMALLWQRSVGKSERLVLVRVHSRCLLLGVTGNSIQVLTELTEEEAKAWTDKGPDAGPAGPSFSQVLRANFPKKK